MTAPRVFQCPDCQARWQREPLTKRQAEIMAFIRASIEVHGFAPTFDEIRSRFGFRSFATVHEHLTNLENAGWIRRCYNEARAIKLVEAA